jgi:hypothetical protein
MLILPAVSCAVQISVVMRLIVFIWTLTIGLLRRFAIHFFLLMSCLLINICCQGDGSPDNVHPHFLYKDGNGHSNHNHRATYLAKAIKDNPERFQSITDILQDVCKIVCDVLQKHLPDAFDRLRVFCEILPLNQMPATYPFPGFVLNIQVCTEAHVDANDDTICVVIPFGPYEGGELVLYEAGLVLEIQEGDILIFPSYCLTHFNLHFTGVRGSVVMHSDKAVTTWNANRNGWNRHIVVKK